MDPFEKYFNVSLESVYKYLGLLGLTKQDSFYFMLYLKNTTLFSSYEVSEYAANYFQFKAINLIWWWVALIIVVVCGFCGIIGYIVEFIILTDKEFQTPSFLYHKGLVVFEFVCAICLSSMYLIRLVDGFDEPFATIFNDFVVIAEMAAMTAIWIAIFMSLERIVALFYPTKFYKVNKQKYVHYAISFSFLFSFHYFPDFWAPKLNVYPQFWSFKLYRENLVTAECFFLAVLSIAVGLGLFLRGKQQLKLGKDDDALARERFQLNKQLCILSISCSVPFFLEKLTYSISFSLSPIICPVSLADVLMPSYTDAQWKLKVNRVSCQFYFIHVIVAGIAHNSHLYCYLLFSKRFQQAAMKLCRKATGKIEPTINANLTTRTSTVTINTRLSVSTRHGSLNTTQF